MSVCTPYTGGIAVLVGVRLFLKVYEPHAHAWQRVVLVADAGLLQVLLWSGVLPTFVAQQDAYASVLVLVFASMAVARVINLLYVVAGSQQQQCAAAPSERHPK